MIPPEIVKALKSSCEMARVYARSIDVAPLQDHIHRQAGVALAYLDTLPAASREAVYLEIDAERDYQDAKWGTIEQNPHSVEIWIDILWGELSEAIISLRNNQQSPHSPLDEIRQVAAVAIAALEQHGCPSRKVMPDKGDQP